LEQEVARLEGELRHVPAFEQWRAARALLDIYKGANNKPAAEAPAPDRAPPRPRARPATTSDRILEATTDFLRGRTVATPTVEILEELTRRGIEVGGTVPRNSLSSLLSRADEFESQGRAGWTLKSAEADRAHETADDANPTKETSSAFFEHRVDHPAEPQAQDREAGSGGGT